MTRSRYRVLHERHPHFMTATVNNWLPVFTSPEAMDIVLDSRRFLQQDSGFEIFGCVILKTCIWLPAPGI